MHSPNTRKTTKRRLSQEFFFLKAHMLYNKDLAPLVLGIVWTGILIRFRKN